MGGLFLHKNGKDADSRINAYGPWPYALARGEPAREN